MAIESDLVILGTVSAVEEGRAAGKGPEEIRFRDVTVEVEEVFLSRGEPVRRVVVQEFGWAAGKAVENPDMPWSRVGQRGYFFLQRDVPDKFGYLGPQARIWIEDGQLHSGGNHELKAVGHVNELSQEAFMAEVVAATQKVSQQQIKNPDGPAVGDGDQP